MQILCVLNRGHCSDRTKNLNPSLHFSDTVYSFEGDDRFLKRKKTHCTLISIIWDQDHPFD